MKKRLFLLLILLTCLGVSGLWAANPFDDDATVVIPKKQGSSGEADWHVATGGNPQWKNPVNGECETGYFKASTERYGSNVCLQYPQGQYISSKERCVVCKDGYYYSEGNDRCQK